jgi:hypothetical protein
LISVASTFVLIKKNVQFGFLPLGIGLSFFFSLLPKAQVIATKNSLYLMFTARLDYFTLYTRMPQNITTKQFTIRPLQSKLDQQ